MMADTALDMQTDSGKAERACAWCGADISHMHFNSVNCSPECREAKKRFNRYGQGKNRQGPQLPKSCAYCGALFSAFDPKQIYCVAKGPCLQKSYRESEAGLAYFARQDVKDRMRQAARRHAESEHGKKAQRERDARPQNRARREAYGKSQQGIEAKRENQRARAAQAALATLLLPTPKNLGANQ